MLCDASVLVPLIVPEPTTDSVLAMLEGHGSPSVSDFAVGEVCSAISIRVRRREIQFEEGTRLLSVLDNWIDRSAIKIVTETQDVASATRLVKRFDLGLRMPDALHLATAQRLSLAIATLDRKQAAAAKMLGLRVIEPLSS